MRIHSNFFGANRADQSSRRHKSNHMTLTFEPSKSKRIKAANWIADAQSNRGVDSCEDMGDGDFPDAAIRVGPYEEMMSGVRAPRRVQTEVPRSECVGEYLFVMRLYC
jgi:hypothetical protein